MSEYVVWVRDHLFRRVEIVEAYARLQTIERLHAVGTWALEVPHTSPAVEKLRLPGAGIEVRGPGGGVVFSGMVDREVGAFDPGPPARRTLVFSGTDDMVWLDDTVAWPDPTKDDPTQWAVSHDVHGPGDLTTVLMGFVDGQCGTSALPGRQIPQFLLDDDPEAGPESTIRARLISVLDVIAKACAGTDVVCWLRQVGDDLVFTAREAVTRPNVRFTDDQGLAWSYERRAPEATVAVVAGQGEMENRNIRIVTAAPPSDWPRRVERLYDQRGESDASKLAPAGQGFLAENGAVRSFLTNATGSEWRFRHDFDLGDYVTVGVGSAFWQDRVVEVASSYEAGSPVSLSVAVGDDSPDPYGTSERAFWSISKAQARRLQTLEAQ